ncbi:MAG: class I SAM-dependent methyltransferase [Planctomycetes bacterium]|nr:class I SAM-dependent methyltransferase [Planctomycetota bacterium]
MALQWPEVLDWQQWADRFDRMQDRYLVARDERFETVVRMIHALWPQPERVLDLGCGSGSLSLAILEAFPECRLVGVDLDESMLALAGPRLARFDERVRLLRADLRDPAWLASLGESFDAVVSSTALHWLSPANLAALYACLPGYMAPGGVFLNADHVGSVSASVQECWQERRRSAQQSQETENESDSWDEFWQAFAAALGVDPARVGENVVAPWEGVEAGMPLAWHFERLRDAGFAYVDCFWRCDGDAVYGGVLDDREA